MPKKENRINVVGFEVLGVLGKGSLEDKVLRVRCVLYLVLGF